MNAKKTAPLLYKLQNWGVPKPLWGGYVYRSDRPETNTAQFPAQFPAGKLSRESGQNLGSTAFYRHPHPSRVLDAPLHSCRDMPIQSSNYRFDFCPHHFAVGVRSKGDELSGQKENFKAEITFLWLLIQNPLQPPAGSAEDRALRKRNSSAAAPKV